MKVEISFKDIIKLYDERLRIKVENELNLTFIIMIRYSNREDEEMAHYLRKNFRTQIDFCQRIGLITISEWSFLYRAADII